MIEIIDIQKKQGVVTLYELIFDDYETVTIHSGTLKKLKLKRGYHCEHGLLLQQIKEAERAEARASVVRSLASRGRSEKQLKEMLQAKGFETECVQEVVQWLHQHKLIDEETLLSDMVQQLSKTKGPHYIKQKLIQEGFERRDIEKCMTEQLNNEDIHKILKDLVHKKMQGFQKKDPEQWRQKLSAWLFAKGYDGESIRKAVNASVENRETDD